MTDTDMSSECHVSATSGHARHLIQKRDTGCISTVNSLMSENDLNIIINISNNIVMFEDKVKRIYIKDVSSLTFHTSPRTIHVRNYICYMIINSCNWLVS